MTAAVLTVKANDQTKTYGAVNPTLTAAAPTGFVNGDTVVVVSGSAALSTTATPVSASVITVCQTTLLFPYVTNATGFETGIAISNTTTDNLGTAGKSVATPTTGTCTLNFYGNAASPTATFWARSVASAASRRVPT